MSHRALGAQFKGTILSHRRDRMSGLHVIRAHEGGQQIGELSYDDEDGTIFHVEVQPAHRRRGIATAMWDYSHTVPGVNPQHSSNITPEALEWKTALYTRA